MKLKGKWYVNADDKRLDSTSEVEWLMIDGKCIKVVFYSTIVVVNNKVHHQEQHF